MTSVVAILNREGVALAADSAVTRAKANGRDRTEKITKKVTKNGNKMIRLNSTGRVSIMITGNADFLGIPWDVIARRYRDVRGDVSFCTVEDVVKDFFDYVSNTDILWQDSMCIEQHLLLASINIFEDALAETSHLNKRGEDNQLLDPSAFCDRFKQTLKEKEKEYMERGICPHFSDYTTEMFLDDAGGMIDTVMNRYNMDKDLGVRPLESLFPGDILESIRNQFAATVLAFLTTRRDDVDDYSELIFTGYGEGQEYPSLVAATVYEGFDRKVNYHFRPSDIIRIDDDRPVAICPFAQTDVMDALLKGAHGSWINAAGNRLEQFFNSTELIADDDADAELADSLSRIKTDDLRGMFWNGVDQYLMHNMKEWEKTLVDADLKSMALLAESLIELTGFHRVLTFAQEGVGGLVDLAIIPRAKKFTWLNRKSWYHQKLFCGNVTSIICNSN